VCVCVATPCVLTITAFCAYIVLRSEIYPGKFSSRSSERNHMVLTYALPDMLYGAALCFPYGYMVEDPHSV